MHQLSWQKSTYSGDSSNCVHVAAMAPDTILLRESDEPEDHVLTTAPSALWQLIRSLK
ncbi:DUF397 domain-containing protein [Streptomyces griseoaurantiacus]|uniref:DUF397 domain-containing protein n=1 Tax=Streptomyces griseoaurantiacus TaxID=68213 RepID=UPI0036D019A1